MVLTFLVGRGVSEESKMADDVCEGIQNALNLIVSTAERSSNIRNELKQTIFQTVSSLWNPFVQLKDSRDSKTHKITELESQINLKTELEASRCVNVKEHGTPSLSISQEPARSIARGVARPGGSERKLYSEALGNGGKMARFKIRVTSKENQTSGTIKEFLISKINPTEIKVGINAFKLLSNGKVLTEKF